MGGDSVIDSNSMMILLYWYYYIMIWYGILSILSVRVVVYSLIIDMLWLLSLSHNDIYIIIIMITHCDVILKVKETMRYMDSNYVDDD